MPENEWWNRVREFHNEKKWKTERDNNGMHEMRTYDSNKYISGASSTPNGTVPDNILQFHHSFSYDCQRYFNLCVVEPNVVVFASGNILHFLNTATNELWFRRGYTGGGIGHVTKNPMFDHIAVGENGIKPPIIIYKWPSLDIVTILHNGTMKSYSYLTYSADGLLLVSQAGYPDYTITLWNWQKSEIALKCKSYNRDVYNVTISPSLPGCLATCGSGHIKFWRISETFTGLKLKSEIGRYGQTEISDIVGVYIMPDGKVVSGCEWGNILLWEEGLITFEICKKNRQPCHAKAITQFEYTNGELISVGMDGWIRIWFYETIDQAYSHNDERFLEIQPIYEYHISENGANGSMLMCIYKQEPDSLESTFWYAQDGNGGIWLIDLHTMKAELPQKIFTCHAGAIADMDNATWGPFVATLSKTGQLHIYNYLEKKLILMHKFNDNGSQVVWFPCQIEATGSTLACAFESGVIRIIAVAVSAADATDDIKGDYVRLIQIIKPHKMAITAMSLNPSCRLLVTGSDDSTVFSFVITVSENFPVIMPIGFVKVPSGVTCLTWKTQCETTLLIGCMQGDCVEVVLPRTPQPYTTASYELVQCRPKAFKFHSVKSAIQRELIRLRREEKSKEKIETKRQELERLIAESPGLEINEETFLAIEEQEPLPEVYTPKTANKVLIAQYISHDIIWLLMGGFDAGYIYEYPSPQIIETIEEKPIKSTVIYDADDVEIRSCLFYKEKKYLFLAMEHGQIRVCRWKPENYTDLSDYWILPMHDNCNGYIPKMVLSHNQKMLFTCGYDGNLFSYEINDDTPFEEIEFEKTKGTLSLPHTSIEDIEEIDHKSLEEMIQQAEYDRIATAVKQNKYRTLEILLKLSEEYSKIVERNNALPKSHQISYKELELDPRITADLNKELDVEMATVREKLAFKVEKSELGLQKLVEYFVQPITCLPFVVCKILKSDNIVYSLRQHILDIDTSHHINMTKYIHVFEKKENGNSITDDKMQHYEEEQQKEGKVKMGEEIKVAETRPIEDFLKDLNYENVLDSSLGIQLNQMLRKYILRKAKLEQREKEWKVIHDEKPDISVSHTHDIFAIDEAKKAIGDYKLKTSSTFNLSEERDTLSSKYEELLNCRKKLYYQQEAFNTKLKAVRTEKEHLHTEVLHLIKSLKNIHAEIPLESVKPLPVIPVLNVNMEFPERKVMIEEHTLKADKQRRTTIILSEQTPVCPDEEYEVLLLDEKFLENVKTSNGLFALFSIAEKKMKIQPIVQDNMKLLHLRDDVESPWERQMKSSRMLRKIYEQDCILRHIQISCENLDIKLDKLERDRLDIVAENVNLNLFLLTLRQEYIILKEFETMENVLHDQVNRRSEEVAAVMQKIQTATDKVDVKVKEITRLHNQIKDISSEYMRRINDNKFRNFLCRIFRKKYKEVKEEDEITTTTTETETDETTSGNNGESELIYLDENICPSGCDKMLYDLAFSMREKRYACEHQIRDAQRIVEAFHKEIQIYLKKLKIIESNLKKNEDDLKIFMLKKQRKLNDVDVTILIKLHQLQYFEESYISFKVHDCVVFDKKKLSNLYVRIQELYQETLELHAKHKHARTHLQRIKLDCNHMRVNNKKLKNEIKLKIMNKFGQNVSLSKLYETILRRIVYDIKANLNETTAYFIKRIKHVKENYAEELVIFNNLIREHTQKLSFLTLLVEEQSKLQKLLKRHIISDEDMLQLEQKYKSDIMKMESILENQIRQKHLFRKDIKNLRLRTKSQDSVQSKEIISNGKDDKIELCNYFMTS
ncbi:cilia- and flagella-associated protein 44 isoform X2 [Solenopsis invicta]|uniref:cilia- and flagella-associated protein 44 isoform X2 n=1 Tax=Solenopsis invicta TaxID=13686 RepID=UPI000E33F839|nr:cilia- and flagella-associated protein 44 isoform X2 [Solenopsis invicta]